MSKNPKRWWKSMKIANIDRQIVRVKTPMLRSDLYDYSDSYVVVKWIINLLAAAAANENEKAGRDAVLKNSGGLDIVMLE